MHERRDTSVQAAFGGRPRDRVEHMLGLIGGMCDHRTQDAHKYCRSNRETISAGLNSS